MRDRITNSAVRSGLVAVVVALLVAWPAAATAQDDAAEGCAMCHEQIARQFESTIHGRIAGFETHGGMTGCITCHTGGPEHMEAGGDASLVKNLADDTLIQEVADTCQNCHRSKGLNDWIASAHPMNGVGCNDCHKVHEAPGELPGPSGAANLAATMCSDCHTDVAAQFNYPSHHPVREGHMDCQSCHNPHGSSIGMLKTEEYTAQTCLQCHTQYQGPFLFEHEPVYEGCETCHTPHGSVANNLLIQNEPFLCLQCHEMHFHAGLEGNHEDSTYIRRYDPANGATDGNFYPGGEVPNPWGPSGYKRAYTTKCTQCHTMVHGSDSPSQTVPSQGKGLMR